ncbi:MAG: leucine--tRNA ligase [Candidatus Aenigmatarchaeota archaeon]
MVSIEEIKNIERKWQKKWEESRVFEANVEKNRRKFFITFPYPYVNGAPHIGHSYTFFRIDSYARFKRLQGYNVLFPQSFHATGEPILGAIERLKEGDETQIETFKLFGASDEEIKKFIENGAEYVARYWMGKWIENFKLAGMSIDWRRTFITAITPIYNRFIEWQYKTLRKKGYVVQGTHPVIWCPKCQSPTGDHDRLKGEGESPIKFYIIKFRLETGEIIPCATLRPETVYGATNIWIKENEVYVKAKVDNEVWILSNYAIIKLKDQLKKIEKIGEVLAKDLVGKLVENPITKEKIPILPANFVDPNIGTGIVMSVPAHAPYDYIGLEDSKKSGDAIVKEFAEKIKIKVIIKSPDYKEIPAKEACEKFEVRNQEEKEKLDIATEEVYKREFHKGVMLVEDFRNVPVSLAKERVIEKLSEINSLSSIWEPSGEVICRCKTRCHVKILENQWFLKYSDKEWKNKVKEAIFKMKIYPEEAREQFINTVEWLENKACTRKTGLGTKLPWDKDWIVETLSDSTIYMALYTIYHLIKDLDADKIKDSFFDYIFLGIGNLEEVSKENQIDKNLILRAREEFEYFYPVDLRGSGKDLIQNHLTFYIFHHTAIWESEKYWPRIIAVNGFVNVAGEKMSKSKGNIIPLRNVLEDYGSDLVRINIISSAEDLNDADWRFENLETFKERIDFIFNIVRNLNKCKEKSLSNLDKFLVNFIRKKILDAEKAYEELKFRSATQLLIFDSISAIKWYINRIGSFEECNKIVLKEVLENLVRATSPLLPHISEEIWNILGNKEFVFESGYPKFENVDEYYILLEDFVRQTIDDIREIISFKKIRPKEIYLIVGAKWKFDLYKKFLTEENPNLDLFLFNLDDKTLVEEAKKYYGKLVEMKRKNEIRTIIEREDQIKALLESKEFIEREFNCKVIIEEEEKSSLDKRKQATPIKIAIYILKN